MNVRAHLESPMTAKELGAVIEVHENTIRAWVREELLKPAFRIGNTACFTNEQISSALALRDASKGRRHDLYQPLHEQSGMYEAIGDAVDRVKSADPAGKGVSLWTIRRWIERNKMLGFRYGRHAVYLLRADVDELIARRAAGGPSPFEVPIGQVLVTDAEIHQESAGEDAA
jgi:DNA-binding transcriptional MerR regulator